MVVLVKPLKIAFVGILKIYIEQFDSFIYYDIIHLDLLILIWYYLSVKIVYNVIICGWNKCLIWDFNLFGLD